MSGSFLFIPGAAIIGLAIQGDSIWIGLIGALICLTGAFLMGWDAKGQSIEKARNRRG